MHMPPASTSTPSQDALPPVAGLIAVVGCDGTGKSTLTRDLCEHLRRRGPTERRYLGLVSGEMGEKIKRLPLIGPRLERRLAAKAAQAQNMRNRPPALWGALIMYGFSLWRAWQLRRAIRLARRGVVVITDRYPQAEIAGFHYDGPGLGLERSRSRLMQRLARRELRLYRRMARYRPALVIRLDIDEATAHARKPDHGLDELRDKIAVMRRLRYNGATIVDIDARRPYPEVLAQALAAIDGALASPQTGPASAVASAQRRAGQTPPPDRI